MLIYLLDFLVADGAQLLAVSLSSVKLHPPIIRSR